MLKKGKKMRYSAMFGDFSYPPRRPDAADRGAVSGLRGAADEPSGEPSGGH